MSVATCGHEVDDGISLSIDEGQFVYDLNGNGVPATTYGTYCADCVMMFYNENRIVNKDIIKLIKNAKKVEKERIIFLQAKYTHCADVQEWHDMSRNHYSDFYTQFMKED